MKKLSIFVDAHVFDKEHQGTKTFIREIYYRLARKPGITLYMAACNLDNLNAEFADLSNVHFVKYETESSFKRLGVELPRLLKKIRPDYAHFQYVVPPIKYCKYIVTTHDILFRDFPEEFPLSYRISKDILFKFSLLRSDIITTVSEYSKQAINKHYGIPLSDISVTPNGVSEKYFDAFEPKTSKERIFNKFHTKNYILYVSRIEPRKNQKLLLEAYMDLKLFNYGKELVFVGHKSINDKSLDNLISSIPPAHADKVKFFSGISDEDLKEFYRGADLFVYPSVAEGFGIPPLEAAAMRIPTICSNATAMSDFTFFGNAHIEPNLKSLTQALVAQVLGKEKNDYSRYDSISEKVKHQYAWDKSVECLYRQL